MSRYESNKQIHKRQREKLGVIFFAPLMLLLGIGPLITRLKISTPTQQVALTYKLQMATDFFSYHKAIFIILITLIMILIAFITLGKEEIKKYKNMMIYVAAVGVFWVFTFLSTLLSSYKQEALWGVPDRAEGMLITTCYVIMMLYTIYAFRDFKNYKYIIIALSVLITILTFLGIFEYRGNNLLLNTELGKKLLVPNEYAQYRDSVSVAYDKGKVYGTLFHYNYMGSFAALMVPLFGMLAFCTKAIKEKIYYGVITIAAMFLLFGSTSRGGLIGLAFSIFIGIIILSKQMIRKWVITIPVVLGCGVVLVVFNSITGGTIFERIPVLISDAMLGVKASDQGFNYLDNIPIRDIAMKDGKITITTQADALTMGKEGAEIGLYDQEGKAISFLETDIAIELKDTRFEGFIFKKALDANNNWAGMILNINGLDTMIFKVDSEDSIYLVDSFTQKRIELEFPETFGFRGKEKLGSARGYIWSRSIPMLKNTLLIGQGPDTFAFEFPQRDYLGKYYAYDTPHMIVDKAHNLYLQIGINQGMVALIAFLVLVVTYIVESIRLYALKENYEKKQIIGMATMLGVVGYLGAGFFNDSVVSVAPVFWILLGAGIAINSLNKHQTT